MTTTDNSIEAPVLAALPGMRHAFFTRTGGISGGVYESLNGGVGSRDEKQHVAENRARMAQVLDVAPENFLTAYQIHSPDVVVVERPWRAAARPKADAMVTKTPRLAIGVSTADCGPVLFADAQARVIGAAHAGWRGALGGVLETTIAAMEDLGADRSNIVAVLGPMIRQDNYEVGPEFIEQFLRDDEGHLRFFAAGTREGHAQFDLAGFIHARLARAGLREISDLALCTYADPARFYSYRRSQHRGEPDYGRHINAIVLSE